MVKVVVVMVRWWLCGLCGGSDGNGMVVTFFL